jgi:transcriptional regulator of arginine metabolism
MSPHVTVHIMNKQRRQFLIKEIISDKAIGSQEELARELKKAGEIVNQATLSRDMQEMGISRINTMQGARYQFNLEGEEKRIRTLISIEIQNIHSNETMVVVRTLPGRAQGVAEMIDSLKLPGVLATLAGDNTIFIAPSSVKKVKSVELALRTFIAKEDS